MTQDSVAAEAQGTWRYGGVRVMGRSHAQQGGHCQDAMTIRTNGDLLVAVVCDGAGSASWAYVGANFIAEFVANALSDLPEHVRPLSAHPEAVRALVAERLDGERRRVIDAAIKSNVQKHVPEKCDTKSSIGAIFARLFQEIFNTDKYKEIAAKDVAVSDTEIAERLRCTLVGAILDSSGGFLFHVGDGLASAFPIREGNAGVCVAVEGEVVSPPENGQYANETFFVTDSDWRDHLRFTPVGPECDGVFLMTDGAAAFASGPGQRSLFIPFANQLLPHLTAQSNTDLFSFLKQVLPDEKVHKVTADDATLVFAYRRHEQPAVSLGTLTE